MDDHVERIKRYLKGNKWIAYLVVFVLVVIGIANFTESLRKIYDFSKDVVTSFQDRKLTDEELKKNSLETAKELINFIGQRQAVEPPIDFENWTESIQVNSRFHQETQNYYYTNFAPQILLYREEFIKLGLRNNDLDFFCEYPTNCLGIRAIAIALIKLANEI